MPGLPDEETQLHTVEAFVLRARRIAEHSLLRDQGAMAAVARSTFEVGVHPDGTATLRRRLLPEEPMESLAARVRPVLLKEDPVHYAKVLKAVGGLLHRR